MGDEEKDGIDVEPDPYTPSTPASYCAIVGPSGAGKTNLILSFVRACTLPPVDAFQIRLRHKAGGEPLFHRASLFNPHDVPPPATDDVLPHEFEVDVSTDEEDLAAVIRRLAHWKPGWFARFDRSQPESTACFRVADGPGGVLFPNPGAPRPDVSSRNRLLREIETSQSLVICIDAGNPQAQIVRAELPLLLSELSGQGGSLRFARVLLLLTQIDRVAERFLDGVRRQRPELKGSATHATRYFCEHPQATAQNLCDLVDPLSLARDLLGDGVLHNLWSMTGRGRKLGIGVCSAWGFDNKTGSLFANSYSPVANWQPFGVREALNFLLNSDAPRNRSIGPIREFVKDGRRTLPTPTPFEIHLEENYS